MPVKKKNVAVRFLSRSYARLESGATAAIDQGVRLIHITLCSCGGPGTATVVSAMHALHVGVRMQSESVMPTWCKPRSPTASCHVDTMDKTGGELLLIMLAGAAGASEPRAGRGSPGRGGHTGCGHRDAAGVRRL
jgi:hypothetical protein